MDRKQIKRCSKLMNYVFGRTDNTEKIEKGSAKRSRRKYDQFNKYRKSFQVIEYV